MKKALSLILALAMTLSLAACGGNPGGSSGGNPGAGSSGSGTGGQNSGSQVKPELEYPVRSINNIIPFGAGGGTDVWNRALMDAMGSIMGQTIVSSNMTGGSAGSIGVSYVWEAPHDGYTLCGTSETPLTIPVMTNLEQTSKDVSRRILDFLAGASYAQEGKVKKVALSTYIITPYNVDILGNLLDELEDNGLYF